MKHEWLEKNQWNIITWKRRFWHSPKYERYYWCRLSTWKKSLKSLDFKIKNVGEYHNFLIQRDTLLLADVFENFIEIFILKYMDLTLLVILLHQDQSKIKSFNWYWYVINGKKYIKGGICHAIHQREKADNKYLKDYDKNKDPSYLKFWDVNNLYEWWMSQKVSVNDFKWVEDTSKFNEDFIKYYNNEGDEEYFLGVDVQYPENLYNLYKDLTFLRERVKIGNIEIFKIIDFL